MCNEFQFSEKCSQILRISLFGKDCFSKLVFFYSMVFTIIIILREKGYACLAGFKNKISNYIQWCIVLNIGYKKSNCYEILKEYSPNSVFVRKY